ncbi:hypothetical protein LEMLEM_LOCUS2079 [Lemmus lemmus]
MGYKLQPWRPKHQLWDISDQQPILVQRWQNPESSECLWDILQRFASG